MESIVVTLDTAKKLNAAQFPLRTVNYWVRWKSDKENPWTVESRTVWESEAWEAVPAPTAQEIADQLPSEVKLVRLTKGWYACDAARKSAIAQMLGQADTMAEALALLWLKLHEVQS